MSHRAKKTADTDPKLDEINGEKDKEEKPPLTLVEFPTPPGTPALDKSEEDFEYLSVDYDSIGLAKFERGSILRIFRKEFRAHAKFLMSVGGGKHSLEDACRLASVRYDTKDAAELMEELLKTPVESVTFDRLQHLWECSPEEAEHYFQLMKMEAQKEFSTGHMAAEVFEPVDWMRSVWNRAKFLAIRDTFIAEYLPDGGIEYSLIDTLAQAHFMQQYWIETAVKRTKSTPVRETYEYAEWKYYKKQVARDRKFDDGWWDIPLISEKAAVENATQMADTFTRLFQRTLRTLNNHRLNKYKIAKLKAEMRRINALTKKMRNRKSGRDK